MNKVFNRLFLALLLFGVLLLPAPVLAEEGDLYKIGSSGTMIGATLESVGYYYQSFVLDSFSETLTSSLAALIYIIAVMIGVFTYVTHGDFKWGLWFFIAPGLFMAAVVPRTYTTGADWQFGGEPRDSQKVVSETMRLVRDEVIAENHLSPQQAQNYNPGFYEARVASVFKWYNNFISATIRNAVKGINTDSVKRDAKFMLRKELLSQLKTTEILDTGLGEFVHSSMFGQCREAMQLGREWRIGAPPHLPDDFSKWDPTWLTDSWFRQNGQSDEDLIAALCPDRDKAFLPCKKKVKYYKALREKIKLSEEAISYLAALKVAYGAKLDEMLLPTSNVETIRDTFPEFERQNNTINIDQNTAQYRRELANAKAHVRRNYSTIRCHEVWNVAYLGIFRHALRVIQRNKDIAETAGLSGKELLDEWYAVVSPGNVPGYKNYDDNDLPIGLARLLAISILDNAESKNATTNSAPRKGLQTTFITRFAGNSEHLDTIKYPGQSDLEFVERARSETKGWANREELITVASSLPYYQGLFLYFLSVSYPFFALLLLVPGKHAGYLMWFGLWLWAKSWDIGFAVVMVLDDILYNTFAARSYLGETSDLKDLSELDRDMSTAIYAMQEVDPTFALATYYRIIAISLQSIPMVSAYLILGGLKGGSGLVSQGLKPQLQYFGDRLNTAASQTRFNQMRATSQTAQGLQAEAYFRNALQGNRRDQGLKVQQPGNSGIKDPSLRSGNFGGMSLNRSQDIQWGARLIGTAASGLRHGKLKGFMDGSMKTGENLYDHYATDNQKKKTKGFSGGVNRYMNRGRRISSEGKRGLNQKKKGFAMAEAPIDFALQTTTKIARRTEEFLSTMRAHDGGIAVNWGLYDSINSAPSQRYAAMSRAYGMIEIPWNQSANGFDDEAGKEIAYMQELFNTASLGFELLEDTINLGMDMTEMSRTEDGSKRGYFEDRMLKRTHSRRKNKYARVSESKFLRRASSRNKYKYRTDPRYKADQQANWAEQALKKPAQAFSNATKKYAAGKGATASASAAKSGVFGKVFNTIFKGPT